MIFCYLTTSVAAIHFFSGTVIISREHLCQGQCVYFTKFIAAIHNKKWSVVDSRKFARYFVYLRKSIVSLLQQFLFGEYCVKCTKALAAMPFFHVECVKLTISQQQLPVSNKYNKFFRRRVVDIWSCKGDFWDSYFLQRATFSVYLV